MPPSLFKRILHGGRTSKMVRRHSVNSKKFRRSAAKRRRCLNKKSTTDDAINVNISRAIKALNAPQTGFSIPPPQRPWVMMTIISTFDRFAASTIKSSLLFHSETQLNGLSVNHESAVSMMMDGAGMFLRAVKPRFDHLQDEDTILRCELCVYHPTFKTGVALVDQRGMRTCGDGWPPAAPPSGDWPQT